MTSRERSLLLAGCLLIAAAFALSIQASLKSPQRLQARRQVTRATLPPFVVRQEKRDLPAPGAAERSGGGILVVGASAGRPLTARLDDERWTLHALRYSRHTEPIERMRSHALYLSGRLFELGLAGEPTGVESVPHLRLSLVMQREALTTGAEQRAAEHFPGQLLLRDREGRRYPPLYARFSRKGDTVTGHLGFPFPAEAQPLALDWRPAPPDAQLTLFYRGRVYGPAFARGSGEIYVQTSPSGQDTGCLVHIFEASDPDGAALKEGVFYLGGVNMQEWTARHVQDQGMGDARELIRLDDLPIPTTPTGELPRPGSG